MNMLITLLALIVTLGILITVHEWGHFFVAKKLGVKVLRFSIGFGKAFWSHTSKSGTEYCLAYIPLGGYVKMLDEREGPVSAEELPFAFNRKNVWARIAIVLAGPVTNLLFAALAFFVVYMVGVTDFAPVVNQVAPDSVASQIGIEPQDEVLAVNGQATPNAQSIRRAFLNDAVKNYEITLKRGNEDYTVLVPHSAFKSAVDEHFFTDLGLTLGVPAVIGEVLKDSPAAQAGLQSGDQIIAIGDHAVGSWIEFIKELGNYPNKTTTLTLERSGHTLSLSVTPKEKVEQGQTHAYIGVKVNEAWLRVSRDNVGNAFIHGFRDMWLYTGLTFKSLGQMFVGGAWHQVSGPITIAIYAGQTAQQGFVYFLQFLALISISLGVINLLPIPMLDGGHLLYYVFELVRRKPLSLQTQQIGLALGLVVLVLLMTLAFYNDVMLLGSK